MICANPRCGKSHNGSFGSGRYCDRKCANSRTLSSDSKSKISKKMTGRKLSEEHCKKLQISYQKSLSTRHRDKEHIQCCCGIVFARYVGYPTKYCSRKCGYLFSHNTRSSSQKNSYASGNRQNRGGRTRWYRYKNINVQGTFELRTCVILDEMLDRNLIKSWEYTKDRVPYVKPDGTNSSYLLDFKIIQLDDSVMYIETKGYMTELDKIKWKAAESFGLNLEIWFKSDIERHENALFVPVV